MQAYVDSSVLVSVHFSDLNHKKYAKTLSNYEDLISSVLLESELCSVIAREKKDFMQVRNILDRIQIFSPTPKCIK